MEKKSKNKILSVITVLLIMMSVLQICAWNMRALRSAQVYCKELSTHCDILIMSEHRLYNCELFKLNEFIPGFIVYAKASADLDEDYVSVKPGHCGILIAWRSCLSSLITKVQVNSDRICAIKVSKLNDKGASLYIIGVYMPHQQCIISDFNEHLAELDLLITKCQLDGEVMVIGDYNCHFGIEQGPRFTGSTTRHGRLMIDMLNSRSMVLVDSLATCVGPTYTFRVDGVGESYIDHCAISRTLLCNVESCAVLEDCLINTSDHLPIRVVIAQKTMMPKEELQPSKCIAWSKLSKEDITTKYTQALDDELNELLEQTKKLKKIGDNDIEEMLEAIVKIMHKHSKKLTKQSFSKGLKPYWNKNLTVLSKAQKGIWYRWKAAGSPRGDHIVHIEYKNAKREFRRERRRAELEYEIEEVKRLAKTEDIDLTAFWHLVNRSRKLIKRINPVVRDNVTISKESDVCDTWKEYFEGLYTPKEVNEYCKETISEVEDQLPEMLSSSYSRVSTVLAEPFTQEEVTDTCSSLKNRKAPGLDGVTSEHLKFGGVKLIALLTLLVNAITNNEYVPESFKRGIIIPIPKGSKDATIMKNNRGITLLSVIAKVYEKLLYKRFEPWAMKNNIINCLQGAAQTGCSSLHNLVIKRNNCL